MPPEDWFNGKSNEICWFAGEEEKEELDVVVEIRFAYIFWIKVVDRLFTIRFSISL